MDPDPTPDPTPFFIDFKDAKKNPHFFSLLAAQLHHLWSKKLNFLLKFCVKKLFCRHYSSPLNTVSSPVKNYICLPVIPIVCHLYHGLTTINIHLFIYLFIIYEKREGSGDRFGAGAGSTPLTNGSVRPKNIADPADPDPPQWF
jgi:hypothetical protein